MYQYDLETKLRTTAAYTQIFNLIDSELVNEVLKNIQKYLQTTYNNSEKNDYISALLLLDIDWKPIAEFLVSTALLFKSDRVQNIAYRVSTKLTSCGFDDAFIDIQIATDLLFANKHTLFKFKKNPYITIYSVIPQVPELIEVINSQEFLPPLIEEPEYVRNNNTSGYHTFNQNIIMGGRYKEHNYIVCLDVINKQNQLVFELDNVVINDEEKPKNKLTGQDLINHQVFVKQQKKYQRFFKNKPFYFNHRYDSRGRLYCDGYHISYQATEYRKAAVSLHKQHKIDLD